MAANFTLYVLHTTHTDIGYTDTQEKVKSHHIAFIREALELVEREPRFRWNCEGYWAVHEFLKVADCGERNRFVKAVRDGRIGLSASYFNLTDLIPGFVHHRIMDEAKAERDALGLAAVSALTADVNGYSWGFADILARQGVKHLMSNIHTHHGYYPLGRKQTAFWWESPLGEKILAWSGDHYMLGNELGLAGTPAYEYVLRNGQAGTRIDSHELAVQRVVDYVDSLQAEGYELPFSPVSVCSYTTDNASPSLKTVEFCERFNAEGHGIELKLATLDEFFGAVLASGIEIPTHRGDWTDWWADGMASTPADVTQYRAAARSLHLAGKLDPQEQLAAPGDYASAYANLMFYGEHTWGHSASITEPFHPQVNNLDQWKRLYALKASESATIVRESIQAHFGESAPSAQRELSFRAVNPHDRPVSTMVVFDVEHFYGHEHFEIVNAAMGKSVPFQLGRQSRGPAVCLWTDFNPGEVVKFVLREVPAPTKKLASLRASAGVDGVEDLGWDVEERRAAGGVATTGEIDNEFLRIRYRVGGGITSIFDKKNQRELIAEGRPYGAFTPIYEVTPRRMGEDYASVRRNLGRNRKAARTQRSAGKLVDVQVREDGPLYSRVELGYELDGAQDCAVILTAYKSAAKLDIDLRLHKTSVWEPENLYLSLPFVAEETHLDKAAAIMRPRIDQLPGSCVDFYALQNAVVFNSAAPIVLVCADAPLVAMGSLEAGPVRLMGEGAPNVDEVYSWVMNNFWETNFKASLGGFHQFHYELAVLDEAPVADAFAVAESMNEGVLQFCVFDGEPFDQAR
ncbi:hypothetical protein AL755_20515 [Arthrobacter sp. ERGS1:01]|uniref:glycoside hydrolase family 38 N-terminal domain-containing protein n=1 Tax=Arthrobacter sp. ERGS1:01 TaxID=1704044 RepID=UPI0006B621F0|nr:glycoside hydrolase family 38 C-terminal domain-containing protein [Arthrobacter sp. ERGS1:01]ALE07311.1 hypothetical protein AL755_20515 [Arthrobacter sp. ERGS1:01]